MFIFLYYICIEFLYVDFPILLYLSVSVKWLAVKTASEMTYCVSGGALNYSLTHSLYPGHGFDSHCVKYVLKDYDGWLIIPPTPHRNIAPYTLYNISISL